jgi:putative transposase
MIVLRSEIHMINKNHRLFKYCDEVCYKSKNLYNYANYIFRQDFINNNKYPDTFELNKQIKNEDVFKELPAKTSQQIIIQLGKNWKSFFKSIKDWAKHQEKYNGKPKIPKYKNKDGRNIVLFDYQQGTLKDDKYKFPLTDEYIETNITKEQLRHIKIIPYGSCYKICIVYRVEVKEKLNKNDNYLAIDLGVDNLATLTNNIGLTPIVINGKILKSINQYYNKKLAKLHSYVPNKSSKRIKKLSLKRNNIVETHMHKISRFIINYCSDSKIDNIIIGRNKDWKRDSKMNKEVNQKFINIPFEMCQHVRRQLHLVIGKRALLVGGLGCAGDRCPVALLERPGDHPAPVSEDWVVVRDGQASAGFEDNPEDIPNLIGYWDACLGVTEAPLAVNSKDHRRDSAPGHLADRL